MVELPSLRVIGIRKRTSGKQALKGQAEQSFERSGEKPSSSTANKYRPGHPCRLVSSFQICPKSYANTSILYVQDSSNEPYNDIDSPRSFFPRHDNLPLPPQSSCRPDIKHCLMASHQVRLAAQPTLRCPRHLLLWSHILIVASKCSYMACTRPADCALQLPVLTQIRASPESSKLPSLLI